MNPSDDRLSGLSQEQKRALLAELLKDKVRQQRHLFPASDGQRAMWFMHQSAPESQAYHVAFSARICSPVDAENLRKAIQAVINRHASLRTTYTLQGDQVMQVVHEYQDADFEPVDASHWTAAELHQQVLEAYRQPFDLETGPVARWRLFSSDPENHVFLITVHHIAIDAWSLWLILDDLQKALQALAIGAPIQLAQTPSPYAGWARWQEEMLGSPEGLTHRDYWLERLAGPLPVLSLPYDFAHPLVQTFRGASLSFTISTEKTARVKSLAQTEGVTLYMLLLALYQVLLSRYSGQTDILVGTPTSGRGQAEYQGTVGYFVNPVVLRGDLSGAPAFNTWLKSVRQTVVEALAHQDYPFLRIVENLHLRQDPSRSPVFQCMFNLHTTQRAREVSSLLNQTGEGAFVDFGGLRLEPYFFPQEEGQFELTLEAIDTGATLVCTLRYHTDLFRQETAEMMKRSFEALLDQVLDDPQASIAQYQALSPADRQRVLVDWNQTQADYPRDLLVHQLFEAQAERTPEAAALIFEDQSLTYGELNQRANRLAHALRARGIGAEQMVGIFLERSLEMVVALLGVLKSGAAYVPMDPIFPAQRIQFMLVDTQMPVIITQQSLLDALPQTASSLLLVDEDAVQISGQPTTNPAPIAGPETLAYVIFTSGSTGRPKGVQISNRALVNFLYAMQNQPGILPDNILASVTTLSFDIAGLEIYLPLVSGARLVVVGPDTTTDGVALAEALEHYGATIMQATPATWRLLLETGWPGRPGMKMLCGGEPLPLSLARQMLEAGGELWNLYGPTETTIWSTLERITPEAAAVSIGRPIANTQIYILDANLQPVPPGVTGTLYIGGEGLARGYLNQPDLTAEKFIPHPFAPAGRIYNTGDLARYLPDGRIECLGRGDSQVKLRGFRIELGEIETVLEQHPAVEHAVVIVREDTPGDRRLVAYFTGQQPPAARELSRFLRQKLPAYMIPAAFVALEVFPQTPNKKVDRKALPAPSQGVVETAKAQQPPATPMEKLVGEIWSKALNVNQVNIFDNFFDLGGHSLLAMRVISEVQAATGVRIEPAYLRIETLGQLAARLDERLGQVQR